MAMVLTTSSHPLKCSGGWPLAIRAVCRLLGRLENRMNHLFDTFDPLHEEAADFFDTFDPLQGEAAHLFDTFDPMRKEAAHLIDTP